MRFGFHVRVRHATGDMVDNHSVALTPSYSQAHAYLTVTWETHVRPRSHPCLTVNEFGKALLTAQVAFTYRVHDLTRH